MTKQKDYFNSLFARYNYDFMALADYNWKMERTITDLLEEENKLLDSMTNPKSRIMRQQWEFWKLQDVFPTTLRYSYITTIYIHIESKLSEICNNLINKNQLRFDQIPGNLNKKWKTYLSNFDSFSTSIDWSVIDEVTKVRNCIIHCNGNISISRDHKYLRALCSSRVSNKIFLSLRKNSDGEWLSVQENYNLLLTKRVRDFFRDIGKNIDLGFKL